MIRINQSKFLVSVFIEICHFCENKPPAYYFCSMLKKCCEYLKPSIKTKYLLFVASFVWAFASIILIVRGLHTAQPHHDEWYWQLPLVLMLGALFYYIVFEKISAKHIKRILAIEKPSICIFAFFNKKSYLMMLVMISLGVLLRRSHVVGNESLGLFLVIMAIPLLVSSVRFLRFGLQDLRKPR